MEPQQENEYEMVKNPVRGNHSSTTPSGYAATSSNSKKLHNNHNKALIIATCFSVLLALCSIGIAVFVLINLRSAMALNSSQGSQTSLGDFSNMDLAETAEDLNATKFQIRTLLGKLDGIGEQINDLKEGSNVTQRQVKLLSEDVSGLAFAQTSFNQVVLEINRTMDEAATGPPGKRTYYSFVSIFSENNVCPNSFLLHVFVYV